MTAVRNELAVRIVEVARRLDALWLSLGTSGNVSARLAENFLITPSGIAADELAADSMVELNTDGRSVGGKLKPSSEWPFHSAIYSERAEAQAIVHVHSPYATALASVHREIPAFHYMVAIAGGDSIRCAPYATFGSSALAGHVLTALHGRKACLLANHGQVSFGTDLAHALDVARWVEELSKHYWLALQIGEPKLLGAGEMAEVIEKFATYGQQYEG